MSCHKKKTFLTMRGKREKAGKFSFHDLCLSQEMKNSTATKERSSSCAKMGGKSLRPAFPPLLLTAHKVPIYQRGRERKKKRQSADVVFLRVRATLRQGRIKKERTTFSLTLTRKKYREASCDPGGRNVPYRNFFFLSLSHSS